jgi:cytochrome c553
LGAPIEYVFPKGIDMRHGCLLALLLPSLYAQDGAAVYKARCASCHDMPAGHTPGLAAIKAMSSEAIYITLSMGLMKTQAEGLSTGDIFALIGYIAPAGGAKPESVAAIAPTCEGATGLSARAGSEKRRRARCARSENRKIVWSAKPPVCPDGRDGCSSAQSAAVTAIPGAVFSGSVDGHLRAYSTSDGAVLWDTDTAREFDTVNGKPAHGGSDAAGPSDRRRNGVRELGLRPIGAACPGNVILVFSVNGR